MIGARALGRVWYRARQFGNVFRARLTAEEHALLCHMLPPPLLRLFSGMHPVAQRHHMDVCLELWRQGWRDPEVLAAALLHDLGKGHLGAWERVFIVVAQKLVPRRVPAWGPLAWLSLEAGHAERGAALVAGAGGAARTVRLIRFHEDAGQGDPALDALHRADQSR